MTNHLPLVFNNAEGRMMQLNMNGSVGPGGRNDQQDVRCIQAMLNALTSIEGAPTTMLRVDGVMGTQTQAAIRRFQQVQRFAVVDGSIEPGRATIRALGNALNRRGALPSGFPTLIAAPPAITRALSGTAAVAGNGRGAGVTTAVQPPVPGQRTGWTVLSSGGFDISIGPFGVVRMNIYATHDTEPGKRHRFVFSGVGVGLSTLPIGFDVWFQNMPGYSSDVIYAAAAQFFGRPRPFGADAFNGLPTGIMQVGVNFGPGWSGTACMFGAVTPVPEPIYAAVMSGMQAGLPGGGISYYVGVIGA